MEGAASLLRRTSTRTLLDGRLEVTEWDLEVDASGFDELMTALVAAAYVSDLQALKYPNAQLAARIPPFEKSKVRKGDFGEILAGILFSHRVGFDVPFQRLEHKPVAGATLQGSDVLGLSLDYGEAPRPVIIEVKFRKAVDPGKHLKELSDSLKSVDEAYLVSSWVAAVNLMDTHPNVKKSFALSAAQQLAKLIEPAVPSPPHDRQAVMVIGSGRFTKAKIQEHWGTSPPVSHLHVITVPDAETVVHRLFDAAAKLNYSDAASGVPALLEGREHLPGLGAPVASGEAAKLIEEAALDDTAAVIESALWLLADWDGMGVARANQIVERSENPTVIGLAHLLAGRGQAANQLLSDDPRLVELVVAVRKAWNLKLTAQELSDTGGKIAASLDDTVAEAVRYTIAAIAHRLDRHPRKLIQAAGATGANANHVVDRMLRFGRRAFWPSQAKAIASGVLDGGHRSMAVKMPTSAGKSLLIELAAANALDRSTDVVVAVLGSTKALVSQLSHGLRETLPGSVEVRSSSGGLDFDLDDVTSNLLAKPGIAVMTPERFDLEWRRAVTGDDPSQLDALGLLVIDEAHLINETRRGARLELVIARALRRGVRVLLLSSQFPDVGTIGTWVGGGGVESTWTPTWLQRFVYFTDNESMVGMIQAEAGDPTKMLQLLKNIKANRALDPEPGTAVIGRPSEAAAVAAAQTVVDDGLVVLYTNVKKYADKLLEFVAARAEQTDPVHQDLEALAAALDVAHLEEAKLLRKRVGIHHADVPRAVRHAVETAARKGLLQYLVCTSTLLEGVDFPTSSVIAVYPPQQNDGKPQIARLRNLAGRAGRAGRFTRGTLIVMVGERTAVPKWLLAFRTQLPPTRTALSVAMDRSREFVSKLSLLELPENEDKFAVLPTLDAVLVAAAIEGAVIDGDLREELEHVLGRTLWWANTNKARRDATLAAAEKRAAALTSFIGGDKWQETFYRTGLPVASSVKLRDRIHAQIADLVAALNTGADGTELLIRLASTVAPASNELAAWDDLDEDDVADALRMWIRGEPLDVIEGAYPDTWRLLEDDLETILPWVLTATIEYIATEADRPELRDRAHNKLGVARTRYGVPHVDLCPLVRRGEDRVTVAEYAAEYDPTSSPFGQTLEEYVAARLAAAAEEAAAAADDSDEPEVDDDT